MTENITPAADVPDGLTLEQSGKIAEVLFQPTVNRLAVLLGSLVQQTGQGDYAAWATIAAFDQTILSLTWEDRPQAAQEFADLIRIIFRRYAERAGDHADAIEAWAAHHRTAVPPVPFPALLPWGNAETLAAFEELNTLYPKPVAAP